jgi:mannose-6-phosphate isomerase-like protein (cupin superfamily)
VRFFLLVCFLALPTVAGPADSRPQGFEHWTAATIQKTAQTLRQKAANDAGRNASTRLADYPNDLFMLADREGDGKPELHENQADIFIVESGAATLVVGGSLVNADIVSPHEQRNGTIEGGTKVPLTEGDVVRIPANVPHQLLPSGSGGFTYFVVKVRGY